MINPNITIKWIISQIIKYIKASFWGWVPNYYPLWLPCDFEVFGEYPMSSEQAFENMTLEQFDG